MTYLNRTEIGKVCPSTGERLMITLRDRPPNREMLVRLIVCRFMSSFLRVKLAAGTCDHDVIQTMR